MSQLGLDLAPPRRIDVTLERLDADVAALSVEQQSALGETKAWGIVVIVSRLRGMERAEEEVLGRARASLADAYDRVVSPGDPAVDALIRTFKTAFER